MCNECAKGVRRVVLVCKECAKGCEWHWCARSVQRGVRRVVLVCIECVKGGGGGTGVQGVCKRGVLVCEE